MKKPKSIQLNIAKPCHEDWQKMTPNDQGRFCGQCEKTVIDFTHWSDTALYNFFADYKGAVCGRFRATQLQKEIHIPYQPKSRLYRIAIACGLTLMFAQIPEAYSGVKPAMEIVATNDDGGEEKVAPSKDKGVIRGQVTDQYGSPVQYAMVEVTLRGIKKYETVANAEGKFNIPNIAPGKYEVSAGNEDNKATIIDIRVVKARETKVEISMILGLDEPPMLGGLVAPTMKGDVAPVERELMGKPSK